MLRFVCPMFFLTFNMVLFSFEVTPYATARYRLELWNGMNQKNFGNPEYIGKLNDKLLLQRIIIGANAKLNPKITLSFAIQDSRIFGWSLNSNNFKIGDSARYYLMNPQEEFFDFYSLNLVWDSILTKTKIIIGRQKITFGDNRIFGPGEWGNTGRWNWDAIQLLWANENHFISGWVGGTKIHDPKVTSVPFFNTEFYGGGLYSSFLINKSSRIEPFLAIKTPGSARFINTQNFNLHWLGLRFVDSNFSNLLLDFTFAFQTGRQNKTIVKAYGFVTKLGYLFKNLPFSPFLYVRYTFATGGKSQNGINRKFEPAYGATDKYYGWMNVVQWSNLKNPEIVLELFPIQKLWVEIKYHWFFVNDLNEKILGLKVGPSKHLGNEFDIFINHNVDKNLTFTGVLGLFSVKDAYTSAFIKPDNALFFAFQLYYHISKI